MGLTKGFVYNATGNSIKFVKNQDWRGTVKDPFIDELKNGKWTRFEHAVSEGESEAAVVYRIKNIEGEEFDWMFAWHNLPQNGTSRTRALTTIGPKQQHYEDPAYWQSVRQQLRSAGQDDPQSKNGYAAGVIITDDSPATYVAIISQAK